MTALANFADYTPKDYKPKNRLFDLNPDLLDMVFSYHDPYKLLYDQNLEEIWIRAWKRWLNQQDLYVQAVMTYQLQFIGVLCDSVFSKYYRCSVLPDQISIVPVIDYQGKYFCTIYNNGKEIISAWVLTKEQEMEETFGDGNWTELNKMHVYTDYDNELYVYYAMFA